MEWATPVRRPGCRSAEDVDKSAGAANPVAGGERVLQIAPDLNVRGLRVAVVTGDDVLP